MKSLEELSCLLPVLVLMKDFRKEVTTLGLKPHESCQKTIMVRWT